MRRTSCHRVSQHGKTWTMREVTATVARMAQKKRADDTGRLAQELAQALAEGDTDLALRLTRRLEGELSKPAASASQQPQADGRLLAFAAAPAVVPVGRRTSRTGGSARQTVVATLAEIGVPARARLISDYAEARFGEQVESRAFVSPPPRRAARHGDRAARDPPTLCPRSRVASSSRSAGCWRCRTGRWSDGWSGLGRSELIIS